ncbi:low affinity iron permease family protein [Rhodococcus jostii]|uniref:Low affinity iron permease n=1 Tax=Rhodococcus jostii TaxID=132919 RepID=A0A1H5CNR9_RHOJO|nr:low affinity iron permease family protein [Rhodococcus jostii]SED68342.1 Low affinity iron permease [Rhodococcus jostii]
MERSAKAAREQRTDQRSGFDRFVAQIEVKVSQAPFFGVCAGVVVLWVVSIPLWKDLHEWQIAIHTAGAVFTLLLVVLLENANRRATEALQEKLNVIAEALAALLESSAREDPDLREAEKKLREAVGLEERH